PEQLPQHGTAGIAKMVDMMRSAGLDVSLELSGELDTVTPEVSLGIHRIVQESLTNTLRHAGPTPHAEVRVTRRDTDVLVDITDSGGVPLTPPTPGGHCNHATGGHRVSATIPDTATANGGIGTAGIRNGGNGNSGGTTKPALTVPSRIAPVPSRIPGSGLGLVGMRERIAVLGGSLTAGRNPHGGWTVRATIPLDRGIPD
ncbi:sensor histidine kinase, partial [Nocardia sp. NPDC004722]